MPFDSQTFLASTDHRSLQRYNLAFLVAKPKDEGIQDEG